MTDSYPEPPNYGYEVSRCRNNTFRRVLWTSILLVLALALYSPRSLELVFTTHPSETVFYLKHVLAGLGIALITTIPHELIHHYFAQELGYQASIQWGALRHGQNPFNYIPNQWISEGEYNLILIGPLIVLNFVALTLLVSGVLPSLNYVLTGLVIMNTVLSADDIHMYFDGLMDSGQVYYRHKIEDNGLVVYRAD